MPDLRVTDAEIDATAARLREAARPIADSYCFDPAVTGSEVVAAALGEADTMLVRIFSALSAASGDAAADAAAIAAALSEADERLAAAG